MQFFRFLCVLCSIIPNLVKATPGGLRAGELSLSDPTRPPPFAMPVVLTPSNASGVMAPPPPAFQLQGIIESGGKRCAIINQRLYTVGQHVGNANIVDIESTHVTLHHESGRQILRWTPISEPQKNK
jgi:hypothetical protein